MEEKGINVLGVLINNRVKNAKKLQDLLTEYGCNIKTRMGRHEVGSNFCSENGLIILELFGEFEKQKELETKLKEIDGAEVQKMIFQN